MELQFENYTKDAQIDGTNKQTARAPMEEGALTTFARSAAYSALQSPLNALAQLSDKSPMETHLQTRLQIIDAPKPSQFLSTNWHMEQLGSVAGMLPWIVALHKATGAMANSTVEGTVSRKLLSAPIVKSGIVGGLYGGALTPSEGDGLAFVGSRLQNAGVTAATFVVLTGSNQLIGDSLGTGRRANAAKGAISGLGAGLVNRELFSLTSGNGLVADQKLVESMYSFGALGVVGGLFSRSPKETAQRTVSSENKSTKGSNGTDAVKDKGDLPNDDKTDAGVPNVLTRLAEGRLIHLQSLGDLSNPTKPIIVEAHGGVIFKNAAHTSMEVANLSKRTVILRFNEIDTSIEPGTTLDKVQAAYDAMEEVKDAPGAKNEEADRAKAQQDWED